MRHLIPFTKDQISIIESSLEASLKYADSEYISEVDAILKEIENNTRFGKWLENLYPKLTEQNFNTDSMASIWN